jgi:carboxymethylenebutenolidase
VDWLLPGIAPTGKRVELPFVVIVQFEGDKLAHEHLYWDQASLLVQVGLLDRTLPVRGGKTAAQVLNPHATDERAHPSRDEQQPMIRRRKRQDEKNTPLTSLFLPVACFHS